MSVLDAAKSTHAISSLPGILFRALARRRWPNNSYETHPSRRLCIAGRRARRTCRRRAWSGKRAERSAVFRPGEVVNLPEPAGKPLWFSTAKLAAPRCWRPANRGSCRHRCFVRSKKRRRATCFRPGRRVNLLPGGPAVCGKKQTVVFAQNHALRATRDPHQSCVFRWRSVVYRLKRRTAIDAFDKFAAPPGIVKIGARARKRVQNLRVARELYLAFHAADQALVTLHFPGLRPVERAINARHIADQKYVVWVVRTHARRVGITAAANAAVGKRGREMECLAAARRFTRPQIGRGCR